MVHSRFGSGFTHFVAVHFSPGDQVGAYVVNDVTSVPALNLKTVQLTHEPTGAKHIHVARMDSNNVFTVGFRTPPTNSSGVPHILEHTTLCGSDQYPCRDPFFKMLTRSLATYMNALTASDYTMYPFSTTNGTDFKNLMGVYLDAVFHPKLERHDFLQEGWRLEHEQTDDVNSPIVFKGVVYNEMKGALSSPDSLFATRAQQHMFPGSTYRCEKALFACSDHVQSCQRRRCA